MNKTVKFYYSPLYKSLVEIVRIRFDCDGETIYHGRINDNDNEILFRASELSVKTKLIEYEIRTIDQHGDVVDVDHYADKTEANHAFNRLNITGEIAAAIIEEHETVFVRPRIENYKTLRVRGDTIALQAGGWVCEA